MQAREHEKRYTYDDYLNWPNDERWELIEGVPYDMAPPTSEHQDISGTLFGLIWTFLRGKTCKVYSAPFGVYLDDKNCVEPDLVVICDRKKINRKGGCNGAPDMVIEVLSPSTSGKDRREKLNLYCKFGVREYWIVDPEDKTVSVHILTERGYIVTAFGEEDHIAVSVLEGLSIDMKEVYASVEPEDNAIGE